MKLSIPLVVLSVAALALAKPAAVQAPTDVVVVKDSNARFNNGHLITDRNLIFHDRQITGYRLTFPSYVITDYSVENLVGASIVDISGGIGYSQLSIRFDNHYGNVMSFRCRVYGRSKYIGISKAGDEQLLLLENPKAVEEIETN